MDQDPAKLDHGSERSKHRAQRSNKQRSLREIAEEPPDLADYMDLLDELKEQHDRAAAVILAAQVEDALRAAILERLISLSEKEEARIFGPDMPLGSLSAKIKIGFALGVYGAETRADLDKIREIRNAFAHAKKPIKFETPSVAAECAKLGAPNWISPDDVDEAPWPPIHPRRQYFAATQLLWGRLGRCAAKYKLPPPDRCPLLP